MNKFIKNKDILILGYGKTGKSLAKYLTKQGAKIYFWDDNAKILAKIDKSYFKYEQEKSHIFDYIYVSPGISKNHEILKEARNQNIKVSTDIELFLEKLKIINMPIKLIAITGTNGKSTIALMIAKALGVKPLGNFGNSVLENMIIKKQEVVLELSSFQLDHLNYLKPNISIISNIKHDHLSYHGGFKNYIKAKIKISIFQDENDYLILNYDDLTLRKYFYKKTDLNIKIIWVSIRKKIINGLSYIENSLFDNYFSFSTINIKKNLFLEHSHNKLNFLMSYAALKCLTLDNKKILNSLLKFKGIPHRMEHVGMLDNIYFYNDSKATNVAATCSALESFNKVILIAGGSQKGESFKPLLKFSNKVYEAYLIGETAKDIKKVLEKNCKSFICQSLEEAVLLSYKKNTSLRKKYPILLSPACASFDKYKNFESRGKDFRRIFNQISNGKL